MDVHIFKESLMVDNNKLVDSNVEFLDTENPTTDLMDGIVKFHLYVTPPGPAREIDFILEYDTAYLKTLFG